MKVFTETKLLSHLQSQRGLEVESMIEILKCLNEIESRKIHLQLGYSSVYEFAETELGYDANEAYLRIRAAQVLALDRFVEGALREKTLSPTSLMLAQVAFNQENKRRRILKLAALTSGDKITVVKQFAGSVKQAKRILAECFPELKKDVERTSAMKDGRTRIQFGASGELMTNFKRLKVLLPNKNIDDKWETFFEELAEIALEKLDPEIRQAKREARAKPQEAAPKAPKTCSNRVRTYISVHARRETKSKAQYRCQYVDPKTDRRCQSTHDLQIDHIKPVALGGINDLNNLRVLCGQHNRFVAWQMGLDRQRANL